jgi:hypothetical protein
MEAKKKEKEPKRKKWGGLWKLTPLWKSAGTDSHSGLKKTSRRALSFFTVPHRPGGLSLTNKPGF